MPSPWDNLEVVAELQRLFTTTRQSANEISVSLNTMFGLHLSRNAVVGRLNRKTMRSLRTEHNKGGSLPNVPRKRKSPPDGKVIRVRPLSAAFKVTPHMPQTKPRLDEYSASAPSRHNVDLTGLTKTTCRWPMGGMMDRPPYRYCGCAAAEDLPYCTHHAAKAYVAPTSRRG